MPIGNKYLFIASMDVAPDKEALFNEIYDTEHVPYLSKVPGVTSVTRMVREPLTLSTGGERRTIYTQAEPKYTVIYEIDSPDVLVSPEWAEAIEAGRWPEQIRPHTSNRHLTIQKIMG